MRQSFDVDVATRYGIKEAIVFEIIKTHYFQNGRLPVCIPMNLILKHAPFISKGTLKRVIANLENADLITKRKGYDDLIGLGNVYELTQKGLENSRLTF